MTISLQNTITNTILTSLLNIKKSNGFQTDIIEVKRGVRTIEDFEGDLPSLSLWKMANEREDSFQPGSESYLAFKVWGMVECEPFDDNYDNLDKLVSDVEKCLMSATYNATYYTNTFIGDTEYYEGGVEMKNAAVFEMEFKVSYFYKFTET